MHCTRDRRSRRRKRKRRKDQNIIKMKVNTKKGKRPTKISLRTNTWWSEQVSKLKVLFTFFRFSRRPAFREHTHQNTLTTIKTQWRCVSYSCSGCTSSAGTCSWIEPVVEPVMKKDLLLFDTALSMSSVVLYTAVHFVLRRVMERSAVWCTVPMLLLTVAHSLTQAVFTSFLQGEDDSGLVNRRKRSKCLGGEHKRRCRRRSRHTG